MKTVLKLVLFVFFLLVVIAIGAVVAVPAFLDPNDHKGWIVEKVQARTGRKLTIAGDIDMSWYPWLGLTVRGVTLGNPAGFSDEPFLHVDLLEARVKLLALLRKEIEMDTVRLHGAVINLAVAANGRTNWEDLAQPGEPRQQYEPMQLAAFAVGGVDVKDAGLSYTDAGAGRSWKVGHLNATTGALELGQPIELTLAADFAADKPRLEGDIALTGTVAYDESGQRFKLQPFAVKGEYRGPNVPDGKAPITMTASVDVDLDAGTARVADLALAALGATATGNLTASRIDTDAPAVQAALAVQGDDLSQVFRVLEVKALADQIARLADRSYAVTAKVDADMKSGDATLADLTIKAVGATITGGLTAAAIDTGAPAVKGTLKAAGPDLPTLLRVGGQFQAGKNASLTRAGKALADHPNRAFDVALELDADYGKGTVNLPRLTAQLVGASIGGHLEARNVKGDQAAVKGELNAKGADLPALLIVAGALQGGDKPALAEIGRKLAQAPDKAFEMATRFDVDMGSGRIDLPQFSASGIGVNAIGNLKANNFGASNGSISGQLAVRGERPGPLLRALDQAGLAQVVQSITADAGISGSGNDFTLQPLTVQATVAGKDIPNSPVTVSFGANAKANLDKQTASVADLSLKGLGLNVEGRIDATRIVDAPAFGGQLSVAPFNLRALLRQLNQEVPRTADPKVLGQVALRTDIAGTADSVSLSKLALTLDETSITGDLAVQGFADPDIQFGLGIDKLNADRYLPPKTPGKAGAPPTPEAAAAGAAQLPIETLRALKLKGNLAIGQLELSGAKMTDVKVSVNARDGRLGIDPAAARLYQGRYDGKVHLDATGKQVKLDVSSTLAGVQLGPLLRDYARNDKLEGVGSVSLNLTAAGRDSDALIRTLNGNGSFEVKNGILHGIDARKVLEQAEIIFESKDVTRIAALKQQGGDTNFEQLTGTLDVKNGVVFNNDLILRSPGILATGDGMLANLVTGQMKYKIEVGVEQGRTVAGTDTYNLGGYKIPIRCAGALDDIAGACKPDYSKLAKSVAGKMLQDTVKDKLGDALGLPKQQAAPRAAPVPGGTAAPAPAPAPAKPEELLQDALKGLFKK
ncbi:MAG: AsmA family protein [Gammaproteobacteria bacterium]|nr:AsmA family protein [Gammaproteobacteria bacterium]